jgi:hypothetical protein
MTRKRTRRKHKPGMDLYQVIAASSPFPPGELARIMVKVHDAFAHLSAGGADDDLFDRLAGVVNVGAIRTEQIGGSEEALAVFRRAGEALTHADDIRGRHGRYGFTGPGLEAMKDAIALYEEILKASTPLQMHKAQLECIQRMRAQRRQTATTP